MIKKILITIAILGVVSLIAGTTLASSARDNWVGFRALGNHESMEFVRFYDNELGVYCYITFQTRNPEPVPSMQCFTEYQIKNRLKIEKIK